MLPIYTRRLLRKTDAEILAIGADAERVSSGLTSISTLSQSMGLNTETAQIFLAAVEWAQTLREEDPSCGPDAVPRTAGRYVRFNPNAAITSGGFANF